MANLFRRIYDWLLRLFWCVLLFPILSIHCLCARLDA
jgi:lipopolysaccharide/colanic/teichoic acid biosynthesis glycosyltransferase